MSIIKDILSLLVSDEESETLILKTPDHTVGRGITDNDYHYTLEDLFSGLIVRNPDSISEDWFPSSEDILSYLDNPKSGDSWFLFISNTSQNRLYFVSEDGINRTGPNTLESKATALIMFRVMNQNQVDKYFLGQFEFPKPY